MRAYSAMVFRGPAQSMPGEIWTLMQVAGKDRDFVFDSTFDAALHAAHFGVQLSFEEPPYMDPRRALDYSNIEESMYVPRTFLGMTMDDGRRGTQAGAQLTAGGDRLRSSDLEKTA